MPMPYQSSSTLSSRVVRFWRVRVGSEKNGNIIQLQHIMIFTVCKWAHSYGQWMFSCSTMHSQVQVIISHKLKVNYVIELSSHYWTAFLWNLCKIEMKYMWHDSSLFECCLNCCSSFWLICAWILEKHVNMYSDFSVYVKSVQNFQCIWKSIRILFEHL